MFLAHPLAVYLKLNHLCYLQRHETNVTTNFSDNDGPVTGRNGGELAVWAAVFATKCNANEKHAMQMCQLFRRQQQRHAGFWLTIYVVLVFNI